MVDSLSGVVSPVLADAARLLDGAVVPMAFVTPEGSCASVNRSWRELFGEAPSEPWAWLDVVEGAGRERVREAFSRAFAGERADDVEVRASSACGARCDVIMTVSPLDGGRAGALVFARDVTGQRANEERLAFVAGHDALTGLANRRSFEEALERAVNRATRGVASHLLLLDIDRLKAHNDTYGHAAGDQVLVNAALMLRRLIRASDLPARIGGDEFAILLEDSTPEEACAIAERIRSVAAESGFVDGGHETGLGFSCGVAAVEASVDSRGVMERVDAALYAAKAAGRNRVTVWDARLHTSDPPARTASLVREAFAHDGFHVLYQPIVDLSDGSVAYFESLVRLAVPGGRVLAPHEFLPVVDRLGLMPRLTRRVLELVIAAVSDLPGVSASVNVSGADLADIQLLHDIERVVHSARGLRGRIIIEVPEAVLLSHLAHGRTWMETLSEAGCRFVLDDFGTGIGMFVLLREPHIEAVKLSATVIRSLCVDASRVVFVKALRELIESQGKSAVAAYVETERLLGAAKGAGFQFAQGFHLGEPNRDLAALAHAVRS